MSKRFGRNQKRKLRAAVAEAQAEAALQKGNANYQRQYAEGRDRRYREIEQAFGYVIEAVDIASGGMSPLIPGSAQVIRTAWDRINQSVRVWAKSSVRDFVPGATPEDHDFGNIQVRDVRIDTLRVEVDRYAHQFGAAIHVFLDFGDKNLRYAISRETMHQMPSAVRDEMVRNIAEQLTRSLQEEMIGRRRA